ncbi:unnamed protein product [Meganyctiphanes norvegica]|uniref:Protein sleepless n=1 Tax=Meganyctiphanes norvegica TaxID=48144 RepID=A0AAV2QX15_MEGNR
MLLASTVVLMAFIQLGSGITCYTCVNVYPDLEPAIYDSECGVDDYHNMDNTIDHLNSCATEIYFHGIEDGPVMRGCSSEDRSEGECIYLATSVACFCTTDHCNSGLCDHCYNKTLTTEY